MLSSKSQNSIETPKNLLSIGHVKEALKSYGAKPLKKMGQNFLISSNVLEKIIQAAELKKTDTVLEIGPGFGALTIILAEKAKEVIAVEKDKGIAQVLREELKARGIDNVDVIADDILNLKPEIRNPKSEKIPQCQIFNFKNFASYKVVANLPYYITNPIIMMFLEEKKQPDLLVLMVQKEVARRICAAPPRMNKLAVFCQFYGQPKIISYVSKKCFWPSPKVDSAIIRITPLQKSKKGIGKPLAEELFAKVVKAGFSQPRKQLLNNFSKELNLSKKETARWLEQNSINPTQRAETITLEQWKALAKAVGEKVGNF